MEVVASSTATAAKVSYGYLANGQEYDETVLNSDGSGSLEYFSTASTDEWASTTFNFAASGTDQNNTTGAAANQITVNKDGTVFLTLFEQGSQKTNVTYSFASLAAANNALSTGNYSAATGWLSWATGSSTGTSSNSGFIGTADWIGGSDSLSGVKNIQGYTGISPSYAPWSQNGMADVA